MQKAKGYPFEGYLDVLNYMYRLIDKKPPGKILDIGIGTGTLSSRLYRDGAGILGIDFSLGMLEAARRKMPQARLIQWDFSSGLPPELELERFDYIISSYAFHHLVDDNKIKFIKQLVSVLNIGGKIIIADVAFKTAQDLDKCRQESGPDWDASEVYITADEIRERLKEQGLQSSYTQVSSCAGVLVVLPR